MSTIDDTTTSPASALSVERNGINEIAEHERRGKPRDLFWPWFAGNVSVLGVSYGAYVLGFGISFWQATVVVVLGVVLSYVLCGLSALAGKRGSAPTMTLSRSVFGVRGNRLPSVVSWILTVGWETSLAAVAVLATATVFDRLGWGGGVVTKVAALVVVIALIVLGGTLGFELIMRLQRWITIIAGVLTVLYIVFAAGHVDLGKVMAMPSGNGPAVIGALLFVMTGFGLGWVNAAADYSRYLPRSASSGGVVFWTTFGSSLGPAVLLVFGLLVSGSSKHLESAIGTDPVGALAGILPTWFLVPFVVTAVLGIVSGAIMDIYSSGLALLNAGLKVSRPVAVGVDGVIMTLGTIYIVFVSGSFITVFQGFLITLGVPIAAWAGIFIADLVLRKRDYAERELFTRRGRYGDVRWDSIAILVVATAVGWGLVTNTAAGWLSWQGYLLGPFGLGGTQGAWAYANLGVVVALVIGFLGTFLTGRGAVTRQEQAPAVPVDVDETDPRVIAR
ncbi:cytosine permease [Curtobacterium sp. MCBD17_003]|uniref:purine-cytosine permease family protein n=1 Tax=Curtobacterium sp. MCBD17_003 TaxID=2175667 RepID=UPI0021ACD83E|nr:cytosine permease [Curtobacterium sp. MCBD17_003]WIE53944.1 cytosine permease [Curtobacterium sp. MCBD17_003]